MLFMLKYLGGAIEKKYKDEIDLTIWIYVGLKCHEQIWRASAGRKILSVNTLRSSNQL